jgi:hypothetical protein
MNPDQAADVAQRPRSSVDGSHGAWRWASAKPALHALLRDYFAGRGDND